MERTIAVFPIAFFDDDGTPYEIRIVGEPEGNVWVGWIEFRSRDGLVLRTDHETTQPQYEDLAYWAEGLEPIYFEGAFERARRHTPTREAPERGPTV